VPRLVSKVAVFMAGKLIAKRATGDG